MFNELLKGIEEKLDSIELKIDGVNKENRYLRYIIKEIYEHSVLKLKDGKLGNKRG